MFSEKFLHFANFHKELLDRSGGKNGFLQKSRSEQK